MDRASSLRPGLRPYRRVSLAGSDGVVLYASPPHRRGRPAHDGEGSFLEPARRPADIGRFLALNRNAPLWAKLVGWAAQAAVRDGCGGKLLLGVAKHRARAPGARSSRPKLRAPRLLAGLARTSLHPRTARRRVHHRLAVHGLADGLPWPSALANGTPGPSSASLRRHHHGRCRHDLISPRWSAVWGPAPTIEIVAARRRPGFRRGDGRAETRRPACAGRVDRPDLPCAAPARHPAQVCSGRDPGPPAWAAAGDSALGDFYAWAQGLWRQLVMAQALGGAGPRIYLDSTDGRLAGPDGRQGGGHRLADLRPAWPPLPGFGRAGRAPRGLAFSSHGRSDLALSLSRDCLYRRVSG